MKVCTKCHKSLDESEFQKNSSVRCGLRPDCRYCNQEKSRQYRLTHLQETSNQKKKWYILNKESALKKARKWSLLHREKRITITRNWRQNNPQKDKDSCIKSRKKNNIKYTKRYSARWATNTAIKRGTLIKQSCIICQNPDVQAHHRDYNKPLDVLWLCPAHHSAWHHVFIADNY